MEPTKTTVVKEEQATTQSPTTGATTKVETKTTTTTTPVDTSAIKTGTPAPAKVEGVTKRDKKIMNITTFGSGVGFVSGLTYAFVKNKGFWGYVGYGLLGTVLFGAASGLGAKAILKGEKPADTATPKK